MYEYKSLPRAPFEQFSLPSMERIIPEEQAPDDPKELSLEDAERLREKRVNKSAKREQWGEQPSVHILGESEK